MIDFMIIGLPRSGTTWAANWLTSDKECYCVHDPLYKVHYKEWDDKLVKPIKEEFGSDIKVGVSCTGIWRWPDWVNAHPAKKIVVTRGIDDVQKSLDGIGFPSIEPTAEQMLKKVDGVFIPYQQLFDPVHASAIWAYLVGRGFSLQRHSQLCEFQVQPKQDKVTQDYLLNRRLHVELADHWNNEEMR